MSSATATPQPGSSTTASLRVAPVIAALLGFWVVLFAAGFPLPFRDDLCLIGAPLHYARTGELVNTLMQRWSSRMTDRFYIYVPLHETVLGIWLRVVGVSTHTLLGFQLVWYAVASVAILFLVRRHGGSMIALAIILAAYVFWMTQMGLRQDAFASAAMAVGLLAVADPRIALRIGGWTLLAVSVLSLPALMGYAIPLGFILAWKPLRSMARSLGEHRREIVVTLGAAAAGALATLLLLLWSIHGEIGRFWGDFTWHAGMRRVAGGSFFARVLGEYIAGWNAGQLGLSTLLLVGATLHAIAKKGMRSDLAIWLLGLLAGLAAHAVAYANSLGWLGVFFCWVGIASWVDVTVRESSTRRPLLFAAVSATFLVTHAPPLVEWVTQQSPDRGRWAAIRAGVAADPRRNVVVDSTAARYIFDYDLPESAADFEFVQKAPIVGGPRSTEDRRPDETWVLSARVGAVTKGIDFHPATLFGHRFNSIPADGRDIVWVH